MKYITFYNQNGQPIAYTKDETHIFLFSGEPVAYFRNDSVYSYSGRHLGRFEDGWIRDNNGDCVFFTDFATGGPIKPTRRIKPIKSVKRVKPLKSVRQIKPIKPIKSLKWSLRSSEEFFY